MTATRWLVSLALSLAVACSRSPSGRDDPARHPTSERPAVVPVGPWESAEAVAELARAPSRTRCVRDDDCVPFHGGGAAPPAVCCNDSTTGISTQSYEHWLQAFRAKYCAGAPCSTPPIPGALPADCFFEGRCMNGTCATACDSR